MITTIKIQSDTKQELDQFKIRNESYDTIIKNILAKAKRTKLNEELVEAYTNNANRDKAELNDWETTSNEV